MEIPDGTREAIKLTSVSGFERDTYKQLAALRVVAGMWTSFGDAQRGAVASHWAEHLPRCQRSRDGVAVFRRLVELPSDTDLYRALRVGESDRLPWRPDQDELVYPNKGWIGAYLDYAKHNQCNLAFHFWSIMTVLGAICHRKFYFDMGSFNLFLNQYTVLTGDSSSGKSTAYSTAKDLLLRFNRRANEIEKKRSSGMSTESLSSVVLLPSDSTNTFIIEELERRDKERIERVDATGALFLNEIATFLSRDAFAVRTRIPLLVELWDGETYHKGTSGKGQQVLDRPLLSMLALGAPSWFRSNITTDIRQGGLLDRTLFVHKQKSSRNYTLPLPPADPVVAEGLVDDMLSWVDRDVTVFHADPDGQAWANKWYMNMVEREQDEQYASREIRSANRRLTFLWKVAGLLALSYGEAPVVSEERFHQASLVLDQEDSSLRELMEIVDESPDAPLYQDILHWIQKRGGCVRRTELSHNFYRKIKRDRGSIAGYMRVLEEGGFVQRASSRPTVWRLHTHNPCRKCKPKLTAIGQAS